MNKNEGTESQKPSLILNLTIKANSMRVPSPKEEIIRIGV